MSTETAPAEPAEWTLDELLALFDVPDADGDTIVAPTGRAGEDERQVVEGTQVLAQAIVAVAKRFGDKSIRAAHAVFSRAVMVSACVVVMNGNARQ